jgi:hypothetical protein
MLSELKEESIVQVYQLSDDELCLDSTETGAVTSQVLAEIQSLL